MAVYNSTNTGAELDSAVDAVQLAKAAGVSDTTVGRLLKIGDFGLGANISSSITNADTISFTAIMRTGDAWVGSPYPGTDGKNQGYLFNHQWGVNYSIQTFTDVNAGFVTLQRRNNNGTWSAWREVADEGNSALIESGSNANGSYTKFPDGTLICRRTSATYSVALNGASSTITWSYPYSFAGLPEISHEVGVNFSTTISPYHVSGDFLSISNTINSTRFVIHGSGSSSSSFDTSVKSIAIGRWK